jgi:hypothetical protein
MHLLLDEDVPKPTLNVLRHVLRGHEVVHLLDLGWSGKEDKFLFRDAKKEGFEALLTNNHRQLSDPVETAAIKKSGLHHICYGQTQEGLRGLALCIGAIVAAMPSVVLDLAAADGQRLVRIQELSPRRRYEIRDPRRDPPTYWPR